MRHSFLSTFHGSIDSLVHGIHSSWTHPFQADPPTHMNPRGTKEKRKKFLLSNLVGGFSLERSITLIRYSIPTTSIQLLIGESHSNVTLLPPMLQRFFLLCFRNILAISNIQRNRYLPSFLFIIQIQLFFRLFRSEGQDFAICFWYYFKFSWAENFRPFPKKSRNFYLYARMCMIRKKEYCWPIPTRYKIIQTRSPSHWQGSKVIRAHLSSWRFLALWNASLHARARTTRRCNVCS